MYSAESENLSDDDNTNSDKQTKPVYNQHINFSFDDYQIDEKKTYDSISNYPVSLTNQNLQKSSGSVEPGGNDTIVKLPEGIVTKEKQKFTKRQVVVLIVYGFAQFFAAAVISLQTPFYPAEAEKKGVSASEYGAVFGIFEFTVFLVSFVYGRYMDAIGPKRLFNIGLVTAGVSSIAFGFLDKVDGHYTFFALSMIIRIVEALGDAAFMNCAFVIIAMEFPDSVGLTLATMDTIFGIGLTMGPIIGGALYEAGGFILPFVSTGVMLLVVAVITFFYLPVPPAAENSLSSKDKRGILQLLKIPEIGFSALTMFSSAISMGYLSATLEPHIRIFELSYVSVGLIIVISGATYAVSAPIWGWICDRKPYLNAYMVFGSGIIIVGFIFIGPFPLLPFDTILWVTCVGLFFHGVGIGATLITSFLQCLATAIAHGFPEHVSTYSLVSGLWMSSFALGNFVGPTISGILYDWVGFRNGTVFVMGIQLIVMIIGVGIMINSKCRPNSPRSAPNLDETEPLLTKKHTH